VPLARTEAALRHGAVVDIIAKLNRGPVSRALSLSLRMPRGWAATIVEGGFSMGSIGLPEMIVNLEIVHLVFGSKKLPDVARGIGQAIKGFKEAASEEGDKDTTTKTP